MEFHHISVLLNESIEALEVKPDGIYADGTLGGGGHSSVICQRLDGGMLLGIDRDRKALAAATERLAGFKCEKRLVHGNFFDIKSIMRENGIGALDGAILDLGVSSPQLDEAERGFSYSKDARLDMRMNRDAELSAYTVVNTYEEKRLADIIYKYGEERYGAAVAAAIVRARENAPIESTLELAEIIKRAFPKSAGYGDKHPAKRTFQAIRIEVNGELDGLENAIKDFADVLKPGGRLAIISFHSLEDRIVKNAFAEMAKGCTCPKDFPVCVCGKKPAVKILTKKPIVAAADELEENYRAHSAKLRVITKL